MATFGYCQPKGGYYYAWLENGTLTLGALYYKCFMQFSFTLTCNRINKWSDLFHMYYISMLLWAYFCNISVRGAHFKECYGCINRFYVKIRLENCDFFNLPRIIFSISLYVYKSTSQKSIRKYVYASSGSSCYGQFWWVHTISSLILVKEVSMILAHFWWST